MMMIKLNLEKKKEKNKKMYKHPNHATHTRGAYPEYPPNLPLVIQGATSFHMRCESPSLILDNWWNLCTNLCHEMWYELGWCNPSVKHGGIQEMVMITCNDEMTTWDDDQVLNLENKKEKQNPMVIKAKV